MRLGARVGILVLPWASACAGPVQVVDGTSSESSSSSSSTSTGDTGSEGDGDGDGNLVEDCSKAVHYVYFVEADASYDQAQHDAIEATAYAFQAYWYETLGVTFYLADPVVEVVHAAHESQWYVDTPDGIHDDSRWYRLGNIKTEVHQKLGFVDFDPDHRVVNYPTLRFDGRVGANFGGAWMDGDDMTCMLGEHGGVTFPFDEQGPAHCLGHVAHEFGHILGLDHEGPETDCMQVGFYLSVVGEGMCSFSPENVAKILADPDNAGWFEATPGQRCAQ
jgi:hypothetical protein